MDELVSNNLKIIWDYMQMNMTPRKADCIIGFGNYNEDIPRRAAELYHQNLAPKVLFTGGLGRNTLGLWSGSEAERFAQIAMECGVPMDDIIIESQSTNTGENIAFTREKLQELGMNVSTILGVHHPFMERRIYAALKNYWPEVDAIITSPQLAILAYMENTLARGLDAQAAIDVIMGDFQRITVYAQKGYQIPQEIPDEVYRAFGVMVSLGYTGQLV